MKIGEIVKVDGRDAWDCLPAVVKAVVGNGTCCKFPQGEPTDQATQQSARQGEEGRSEKGGEAQ